MLTIVVFQAKDGRWNYCPSTVRHWLVFDLEGTFPTEAIALEAVLRDASIPKRHNLVVER